LPSLRELRSAIIGLSMFIGAIFCLPPGPPIIAGDRARELGAPGSVNAAVQAGRCRLPLPRNFFVGDKLISVRDAQLESFWKYRSPKSLPCKPRNPAAAGSCASTGLTKPPSLPIAVFYAEHLARVAESTIRSAMRPALIVSPPASRRRRIIFLWYFLVCIARGLGQSVSKYSYGTGAGKQGHRSAGRSSGSAQAKIGFGTEKLRNNLCASNPARDLQLSRTRIANDLASPLTPTTANHSKPPLPTSTKNRRPQLTALTLLAIFGAISR